MPPVTRSKGTRNSVIPPLEFRKKPRRPPVVVKATNVNVSTIREPTIEKSLQADYFHDNYPPFNSYTFTTYPKLLPVQEEPTSLEENNLDSIVADLFRRADRVTESIDRDLYHATFGNNDEFVNTRAATLSPFEKTVAQNVCTLLRHQLYYSNVFFFFLKEMPRLEEEESPSPQPPPPLEFIPEVSAANTRNLFISLRVWLGYNATHNNALSVFVRSRLMYLLGFTWLCEGNLIDPVIYQPSQNPFYLRAILYFEQAMLMGFLESGHDLASLVSMKLGVYMNKDVALMLRLWLLSQKEIFSLRVKLCGTAIYQDSPLVCGHLRITWMDALQFLEQTSTQKKAAVRYLLSSALVQSHHVEINTQRAFQLAKEEAAERLGFFCILHVSEMYRLGVGTERDLKEARKWLQLAHRLIPLVPVMSDERMKAYKTAIARLNQEEEAESTSDDCVICLRRANPRGSIPLCTFGCCGKLLHVHCLGIYPKKTNPPCPYCRSFVTPYNRAMIAESL